MKFFFAFILTGCCLSHCFSQYSTKPVLPGAYRMDIYVPLLKGKRIGVFANQTSVIGNMNLIDTLLKQGINITKIFSPEHGFRGNADAGASTDNYIDSVTHLPVVSLYGKKMKPTAEDFNNVDV